MGNLTQTTAQVQTDLDAVEAANVGLDSLSDLSDTTATAATKSGFYGLGASSSNAPSTARAVMITAARDVDASGEIRRGQIVISEGNALWFNSDDGGVLDTWRRVATRSEDNEFSTEQTVTTGTTGQAILDLNHTHASNPYGIAMDFTAASPDNNTNFFFRGEDSTAVRVYIYSDGDIQNHDNAYGAISAEETKQDIVSASPQKDDIRALAKLARKYRNKSDVEVYGDAAKVQLGFVAEEVEKICPGLVKEYTQHKAVLVKGKRKIVEAGKVKGVIYSVAYMKALVALGELSEEFDDLTRRVRDLESDR